MTIGVLGVRRADRVAVALLIVARAVRHAARRPSRSSCSTSRSIAIATALVGPLVWRLFRRIDAAYARTHRERDAALEGLAP